MKLVRTLSMFIALAGASTVYAQAPKAPAEKKAPAADKAPAKAPEKAPDKAAPPAKEEMSPADVKKAEAFFDEFFDAVMKNQDACPKMATAINATLDKHQKWLETVLATGKDVPQTTKDKMQKKQQEMMGGMMKCKDDKDVGAAFQRFVGMMMKKKDIGGATSTPPAKK
jgi:hypothetical protein